MIMLLFASALLAVSVVCTAAGWMHDIPESVSSLVYLLGKSTKWLWTAWLWAVSFTLCPSLVGAMPDMFECVGFLTILCVAMCGATPLFVKERNRIHGIFGVSACLLSQVCVALICPWSLILWLAFLYMLVDDVFIARSSRWYDGKITFVAESVCALGTYVSLFVSTSLL